jgi:hypothetical protein
MLLPEDEAMQEVAQGEPSSEKVSRLRSIEDFAVTLHQGELSLLYESRHISVTVGCAINLVPSFLRTADGLFCAEAWQQSSS